MTVNEIVSEAVNMPCWVVGGYVRDKLLGINNDDYDYVVLGSGKQAAENLVMWLKDKGYKDVGYDIFENFGTAHVRWGDYEVEFVGARKESYRRDSRKPIVENGTLLDDLTRRDFTINAMAIQIWPAENYGELVDVFDGQTALKNKILITPENPDITFSDDPLRIFRCIRFAVKLGFTIDQKVWDAIKKNKSRLSIVSVERIMVEFNKIMASPDPSRGILLLHESGILKDYLPELENLSDDTNSGHKDNLMHSIKVLKQLSEKTDNLWLRWAGLLHDIGKAPTAKKVSNEWTFYDHEYVGADMVPAIFRRLGLPCGTEMKYVQKMVKMHMRPGFLDTAGITDSAVRRLVYDAGEDNIDDLMTLCESDLTSGNPIKRERVANHYKRLREIIEDLKGRDLKRLFQPVLNGDDVMRVFNLKPGKEVGEIKALIKNAVLDGLVPNEKEALINYIKMNYYGKTRIT